MNIDNHWSTPEFIEAQNRLKNIGHMSDNMDLGNMFDGMMTDFVSMTIGYIAYYASIIGAVITVYLVADYSVKYLINKFRRA